MDIRAFLKTLYRYRWILIIIPIVAAVATYFLVKELPKEYKSSARISTGIIDPSQQLASDLSSGYFSQGQQFGNIMEMMKMKKMASILAYNLILHDLENPEKAFKKDNDEFKILKVADRKKLIEIFTEKLRKGDILSLSDIEGTYKLLDLAKGMGYAPDGLSENTLVNRQNNSDFIDIEYTSEDPKLSAFVVNTFANEFIHYYGLSVNANQSNSINLLDSLLHEKEKVMNAYNLSLKEYKMKNGVLNVEAQSSMVYGEINANERSRAETIRQIRSLSGAIAGIEGRLNDSKAANERKVLVSDNAQIVALKNQIQLANERYISNNFDPNDKAHIDELQNKLSSILSSNTFQALDDPKSNRQSLIAQKREMLMNLDLAKNSLASINNELKQAKGRYNKMVPFDAGIGNYERNAEVATKEYLDVLNKTSQSSMELNTGVKLKLAEIGMPGVAEPGKTMLFTMVSGLSTFVICLMILLIGFLLDRSVNTPTELENATNGANVIGQLNEIKKLTTDVKGIWSTDISSSEYDLHKDLMRSIRFEIDKHIGFNGSKVLGVTSLSDGVGKSFLAVSLAYAFAKTKRKILLIGEGDLGNKLSDTNKVIPAQTFEKYLAKREIQIDDLITILNVKMSKGSLFEIESIESLKKSFDQLKQEFDVIIIDIESIKEVNKAKEWLLFVDRIIGVFKAGDEMKVDNSKQIDFLNNHKGFAGWILNKSKLKVG